MTNAELIQENQILNKRLNTCLKLNTFYEDRIKYLETRDHKIAMVVMNDKRLKEMAKLRNLFTSSEKQNKRESSEEDKILISPKHALEEAPSVSPATIALLEAAAEEEEEEEKKASR